MKTLTLEQTAEMLNTCAETVVKCIRSRGLPARKIGRAYVIIDVDVFDWLRLQPQAGTACDSTNVVPAVRGGSTSRSPVSPALTDLLARRTARPLKSTAR